LKLLLDENLSRRLHGASDLAIWTAARAGEFVLVSKDDDFQHLALVRGAVHPLKS